MRKLILAFIAIFTFLFVGCGATTEDFGTNMTDEEKANLLHLMEENLEGDWLSENGDEFVVTPQGKFLYEGSTGLISLSYNLIDPFNVQVVRDGTDKLETKSIYFEDMGDKFKLEFNKKTYYKDKQ